MMYELQHTQLVHLTSSTKLDFIVHQTSYIVHINMTNEQLTSYLQDESYLYSLNYEELKSLVVQYPYATNLRVLLLKKAYIEQNKDYDRHLNMAAAYTTDRRFLYRAIKRLKTLQIIPENVILGEDYLELSALSDLDKVVKEKQALEMPMTAETAKALSSGFILDFETPTHTQEDEEAMFDMVLTSKKDVDLENLSDADLDILVENLVHEYQPNGVEMSKLDTVEAKTEQFEAELKIADSNSIIQLEDLVEAKSKSGEDDIIDSAISTMNSLHNEQNVDNILQSLQPEVDKTIPLPDENSLIDEILATPMLAPQREESQAEIVVETTFVETIKVEENEETEAFENKAETSLEEINITEPISIDIEQEEPSETVSHNMPDDVIIEPIKAIIEKEEIAETPPYIKKQSFITFTRNQHLFDKGEDEDMKKQDIELEIINQTKATITQNEVVADTTPATKVSFAEWLQQFKMVSVTDKASAVEAKVEQPPVQTTTTKPTVKTTTTTIVRRTTISPQSNMITELPNEATRIVQKETLSELFEKKEELPENLFNLPTESEMLDEADYKGKIEAIFDDFLTHKVADDEAAIEIGVPQSIENEAVKLDTITPEKPVNTEGVVHTNGVLDINDEDDEEDDELPPETKTKKLHEWAKQSIVEDDDLVSETLANLFANQGNYKKAIDIYERLSLQIPEKSNFFAAKIQELRIKLISIF
jgi:hypothetical protein